jgi:putative nucleotidyltransferase with HDIG domain
MNIQLPSRHEAMILLEHHVQDAYQRHHAVMVATAMEGYAEHFGNDKDLWYITGLLHDIDFEQHPNTHPQQALEWFKEWNYPEAMHHAVEAHAYGYNGFTTLPQTKIASALLACDEMCGIFYAYKKLNPIPYKDMKASSIKKRFNEKTFASKIDRSIVLRGCDALGISIDQHIENMIGFLGEGK